LPLANVLRSFLGVADRVASYEVRQARERLAQLGRWYASRPRIGADDDVDAIVAADRELAHVARSVRTELLGEVERRAGPFDAHLLTALLEVPRERFVRSTDIAESAADTPLLLDAEGLATVSAPHAYLLSFRVLGLRLGDRLAELGSGSGYGAALASRVVGEHGCVVSIEIDHALAARATRLLNCHANVRVITGDAGKLLTHWSGFERVTVTFAVEELLPSWLEGLPEGGRLVAPVGTANAQRLVCVNRQRGELVWTDHGAVRYVRNRGELGD
jgi:protein-L-isoaspartate(D-aspartate) O-methyltransferase